ncbi:membrane protein [Propionigenium maris DSM 9537]|uniref:Membrane protein n=1 Tax=Propionigenium maris DSM 9537 TaxID=1123000 RepID=A0A9W6GKZ1_9FUSO|nr:hemolysin family protein [Propionigenium maris]GLI57023.1 membrane protein [Propionigenium maris DSM 9537]
MDTYGEIILLIILIGLSGFFSASETALTAFKSNNLEDVEDEHPKVAELLRKWLKKPNEMLTGILLGNNIVNILASSIATAVTFAMIGNSGRAIAMVTLCMTVVILIFGEITPKVVAKNYSSKVAMLVILPIYYVSLLTLPVIKVLIFISKVIGKIFGIHISDENLMITEEDIISYVNVGEAEGVIEEDEKEMIHSIFEFGETSAKEVMTPRTSMFALEADQTIDEVWEEIKENGFSRIPVYDEEGIDNIIGILYLKDLLDIVKSGKTDVPVGDYLREVYFVPETKSIMEILEEFKRKKVHIAIALDEYGGTVGVLTIEDLIEEIVGEIQDEYDKEEDELIKAVGDEVYEVDAMIDIETLNKELDIELPESEDYESLGGLVVTEMGKVADVGDSIQVGSIKINVLEVDKMRVSKVLLHKISDEVEE